MDTPSVRERVLEGWATYLASELSTTVDRNRRAPVNLAVNEQKIVFVDGDEFEFEEDDAFNRISRAVRFDVEIYLRADLASIGPRLNDVTARVELAVYRNRGLQTEIGGPELCQPAATKLLDLQTDFWRDKNTEPGGSISLTFQCAYAHAWDNPYELC